MGLTDQGIPILGPILNKIIGTRNERFVRKYTSRVEAINALEPQTRKLTDAQLKTKLGEFRDRLYDGTKAIDVLVDAFAVAREGMDRAVGIRNIFNPEHGFDPEQLPAPARALFDKTSQEIAALDDVEPVGSFLGCAAPVPAWLQVEIPVELYEAVRDLYPKSRPPFRARPFDVQLIGGMVLYQSKIAEMKTGEGKTIVAPLATYLAAIEHYKIHVVTVNDYLVQRDRDWTFPFFHALGLTVGAIHPMHMQPEDVKRQMYNCDVVYGTTSEFGFDYLRDNMKRSVETQVQRRREMAIVDEVDSTLIDEARTPLIISGPAHDDQPRYDMADRLARHLESKQTPWQAIDDDVQKCKERIKGLEGDIRQTRDKSTIPDLQEKLKLAKAELPGLEGKRDHHAQYYELQMDRKQCHLTHDGIAEAQREAGIGSFYVDENMDIPHLLEQALRAHAVYKLDRDYVIMSVPDQMTGRTEPTIVIVDTFTGRPMIGRQWSDGLHQAIESKEKVPIKQETQTVATITIQNFFKMYKRLAGMTGTADTEAQEFHDIYSLDVVSIPTNEPVIRGDHDDLMFLRANDKWDAIVDEIKAFHDIGRPILVGTTSVQKSEMLAQMLSRKHSIKHNVLNAKQHESEARLIENAGCLGAVMIATNMAGRGTDIKLGSTARQELLDHWLKRGLCSRELTIEADDQRVAENVYRKIGASELGLNKREVEQMDFAELEMALLRHWAMQNTWESQKKIDSMSAEKLREALDANGRFLMHRVRWFDNIQDMGGLHVIGTERHEARRIDNQLRGRSGRQGDKGSTRFFVSLDDDLMQMFAGDTTMKVLSRLGMKEGDAIEHPILSKSMERAQRKVEERNFQVRKNILEYDEVMEHQRQTFYGLRQRVLEGRDMRGLILDNIGDAVGDACDELLDKDYAAQCAAEFAKEKLDCSILPERLRGRDDDEMDKRIRIEAKDDVRTMIGVTLGEYMPMEGSEVSVDFDSAGLINWAKSRFGVEINAAELRSGGADERHNVQTMLTEAAVEKIDAENLDGLAVFTAPDYGAEKLCEWVKSKFDFEISIEDVRKAEIDEDSSPYDIIMERTEKLYDERERNYPVDFAMDMTMAMARQSPQDAIAQLVNWSNRRFETKFTVEQIQTTPPVKVREMLLEASNNFIDSGRLQKEMDDAVKCPDDESLDAHLKERLGVGLPEWMKFLKEDDRDDAIRARVESILRAELLHLERTILLETLDTTWKDHLYEMDQLRDAIGFRAFSQQDPRIEFKREGSRLFQQMLQSVRDRITDYIFKARISPGGPQPGTQRPIAAAQPAMPAALAGPAVAGITGSSISGPGLAQPVAAAAPASDRHKRDLEAAQKAGTGGSNGKSAASMKLKAAQAARAADKGKKRRR